MKNRAALIISEMGLQSLMTAGISTGWVKAWLMSAGAGEVAVHLLESGLWHADAAEWQVFFCHEEELKSVAQHNGYAKLSDMISFTLDNPNRRCWSFSEPARHALFLSLGDIAFHRHEWLSRLNGRAPLLPLYVRADDSLDISLEPGLSASLSKPDDDRFFNAEGLLIEEQVIAILNYHKLSVRTVESCTAGGIATRLCRVPGASDVVDRAWVTYSNASKMEEVGVDSELLAQHGAVSEAVVRAMAEGGAADSHVCIAVSGIAGPGGGTSEKPVGTVWIAFSLAGQGTVSQCLHLSGARYEIQSRSVIAALGLLLTNVG